MRFAHQIKKLNKLVKKRITNADSIFDKDIFFAAVEKLLFFATAEKTLIPTTLSIDSNLTYCFNIRNNISIN